MGKISNTKKKAKKKIKDSLSSQYTFIYRIPFMLSCTYARNLQQTHRLWSKRAFFCFCFYWTGYKNQSAMFLCNWCADLQLVTECSYQRIPPDGDKGALQEYATVLHLKKKKTEGCMCVFYPQKLQTCNILKRLGAVTTVNKSNHNREKTSPFLCLT